MNRQSALYRGPTADDLTMIPEVLTSRAQWVLYQLLEAPNASGELKLTKVPINPHTLKNGSTTNPTTWGSYDVCVATLPTALKTWDDCPPTTYDHKPATYQGAGIGFVCTTEDPFMLVDLDHSMDEAGAIAPWAQSIIDVLQSYTQRSVSGTGVHVLVQAHLPTEDKQHGDVQMWDHARFVAMTGWHLPETPRTIERRQSQLDLVHAAHILKPKAEEQARKAKTSTAHAPASHNGSAHRLSDQDILTIAGRAKNSAKFNALWRGDTSGYASPSEADEALLCLLVFYTRDPEQLDALFRQSGLCDDKWEKRQDYRERTITKALDYVTEQYDSVAYKAEQEAHQRRNGHTPGPEPTNPYACPELPASAKVNEEFAAGASIFLDDYVSFSKQWAPRAYEGFHEAAALFALSTAAARRVKIEFGPHGVYTSLYMTLAARTSLFTKTTAVDIALELLRRAGLFLLLADDDATPQAFLRSLTLHIPSDYAELPLEAQQALKERLAFAGQKGWFYEEWGQHLHAMMQKEGQMAAFRSILRRLDDHKDEYVYSTISRGRDVLIKPYVALLANVTPADLKPFMRAQSPLWRDGYIARFAFIAPGDAEASTAAFPDGAMTIPRPLITTLASWHKRLGIPQIAIDPILDEKGKATGRYRPVFTYAHKDTTYVLSPEVRKAFYAYDEALHALMAQSKHEDLDGSYARFPMKALRIAGLLASLHDDSSRYTIWPAQWYRGQQIAERWRQDLHKLIKQVHSDAPPSQESRKEQRVLEVLRSNGALSMRDLHLKTKLAYNDIEHILTTLVTAGVVHEEITARTKKYAYIVHEHREP